MIWIASLFILVNNSNQNNNNKKYAPFSNYHENIAILFLHIIKNSMHFFDFSWIIRINLD